MKNFYFMAFLGSLSLGACGTQDMSIAEDHIEQNQGAMMCLDDRPPSIQEGDTPAGPSLPQSIAGNQGTYVPNPAAERDLPPLPVGYQPAN